MKRFFKNLEENLADAALLEMGVDVPTTANYRTEAAREPLMITLKRFFQNFTVTMADAALLEIGVSATTAAKEQGAAREALDGRAENFKADDQVHNDECQYGDNDVCYTH